MEKEGEGEAAVGCLTHPRKLPPPLISAAVQAAEEGSSAPGTETERPCTDDYDAAKGTGNGSRANLLRRYRETLKRPDGAGASIRYR